jgi:hypothetical protein
MFAVIIIPSEDQNKYKYGLDSVHYVLEDKYIIRCKCINRFRY